MMVVDLRRAFFYQKCFDPDCRGYRCAMLASAGPPNSLA
jgi:hypothetical protein